MISGKGWSLRSIAENQNREARSAVPPEGEEDETGDNNQDNAVFADNHGDEVDTNNPDDAVATNNQNDSKVDERGAILDSGLSAFFRSTIGYDTNVDEEPGGAGGGFHQQDAGFAVVRDTGEVEFAARAEATWVDYFRGSEFDGWSLQLDTSASRQLNDTYAFEILLNQEFDHLDRESTSSTSTIETALVAENTIALLRLTGGMQYVIDRETVDPDDDETVPRVESLRSTIGVLFLLAPDNDVSPFLRASVNNTEFTHGAVAFGDRNADSYVAVIGLRLQPIDGVTIEPGLRLEERKFRSALLPNVRNVSGDVEIRIEPVDGFALVGSGRRFIDHPDSQDTSYLITTLYELDLEWVLRRIGTLSLNASYEKTREPELLVITRDVTLGATLARTIKDRFDLFAAVEHTWSKTSEIDEPDEKYERTEIRAGVEVRF